MLRKLLYFFLIIAPTILWGQFTDDFSDGNFTQNPPWMGIADKFVVEEQMLRLNDNQAGEAWLATQSNVLNHTQWEFWVRLAFTPSNNNHPRIYLVSDSNDLSGPLNGYYIRIGKDGTDNKRLYFYRQTGETATEIMAGSTNLASSTNNRMRMKVTRDDEGNWEFWADPTGGELFLPQGSVNDGEHTTTSWFGLLCRYTVSNASNFWFDDFYVGDIIVDNTPPAVNSVIVTSATSLEITFSKAVDLITAENINNYFVNQGIGAPASALRFPESPNKVMLSFANPFQQALNYSLTILNVQDVSGNTMLPFTGSFSWYIPQRFDVVFNEIMANPTPEVGLPPHEYVELYNTSGFEINMQGWTFQHGTTQRQIPNTVIAAGGFLVLTHPGALNDMEVFGNVVAIPGLSSTALTNAGATLMLYDSNQEIISWVSYSEQWYGNENKATGGWALEKIDPLNFCQGATNWRASNDARGGSPGIINSVRDENPDNSPPQLLGVAVENPLQLTLYFNESMDEASLLDVNQYMVNNGIGQPIAVSAKEPGFSEVNLILANPLEQNLTYEMVLGAEIADCAGNGLAVFTVSFADYQAQRHDIVFSEIMANPTPAIGLPPQRYLEVYNNSGFPVHLRDWSLYHGTTQRLLPFIFVPAQGYAIITTEAGARLLQDFPNVYGVPGLSVNFLTNGGLPLLLESPQGNMITYVHYTDQWYRDASKANGGWSLEKIDLSNFCEGAANWTASTSEVGGTPGTPNAAMAPNPDVTDPYLLRAGFEANNRISLFFSESMEESTLTSPEAYTLDNGIGHPDAVVVFAPEFRRVDLLLDQDLQPGMIYEVTGAQSIADCAGNTLSHNRARVAIPEAADSLDVVINELMFNPPERGVRYVEIYNRSPKTIDLQHYILSSKDTIENVLSGTRDISQESWLLFPGDFVVLTPNPEVVKNQFMTTHPLGFIAMTLSSMTNSGGIVVLASKGHRVIDMFVYNENMHYVLLTNKKGVALERLNYHRPTQSRSNWHSAAQHVGFGTPAYQNSQFTLDPDSQDQVFELYPKVFSPDNDGVDDVLNISYAFESPGFTANIVIYDSRGRRVRTLSRSELLATQGVIVWDGATDQGQKGDMGIYIVHIELFNPQGSVKTYRMTTVLGGRL